MVGQGTFLKQAAWVGGLAGFLATGALADDPIASNNGLYPEASQWSGRYLLANFDYPQNAPVEGLWRGAAQAPLTPETAPQYLEALKRHLEPDLRVLIDQVDQWDPKEAGWYDMVWSGEGSPLADGSTDPTSGREALMNTYTGQILPPETFTTVPPASSVQNHAVIYYNDVAATTLRDVWGDLYAPRPERAQFRDGAIVVKAEAVPLSAEEWPVLRGAASWHVFRPSIEAQTKGEKPLRPEVLEAHPIQMAIKVKDSIAAPETGWVYLAYVYDADHPGKTPWDRFVPLGAMWGNDPDLTNDPDGLPPGATLRESWINPEAPAFTHDTLGWGGRLAGPMDVATRHNVITPSGRRYEAEDRLRASSCLSCHGAAEFPFTANLYPSPNRSFPRDGDAFLLYDPGTADWARWFQNRRGDEPMSSNIGGIALDYDMVMMFALSNYHAAMGAEAFVRQGLDGH